MINVCGMISTGKSIYASLISELIATEFYSIDKEASFDYSLERNVDNMFVSQIYHCSERYRLMRKAMKHPRYVLNRHMIEDLLFAEVSYDLGRITYEEKLVHQNLMNLFISEIEKEKSSDLYIYLKCDHDYMLTLIDWTKFHPDEEKDIKEFYMALHSRYDEWMTKHVDPKELMVIDIEKRNINDPVEREEILSDILLRIESMGI